MQRANAQPAGDLLRALPSSFPPELSYNSSRTQGFTTAGTCVQNKEQFPVALVGFCPFRGFPPGMQSSNGGVGYPPVFCKGRQELNPGSVIFCKKAIKVFFFALSVVLVWFCLGGFPSLLL